MFRLEKLEIHGFKSFADKTTLVFGEGITGVVGPNGCGKSNVIDAIRWVLGESSARQLRGEHMQDVIFNGSGERKPVGRASVELIFDNTLGKAAGPWSAYAEISVKRVLERDGESSYFLNNLHVRRRDVADIFLGTGLGGRGYAIIEQGMISRIIEAKPEDLRSFLEEAAGGVERWSRRASQEPELAASRSRADDEQRELRRELAAGESGRDAGASLDLGVGGARRKGSLKCLHAHAAFALARPGYELGDRILAEVEPLWPDRCCTEDLPDGSS